MGDVNWWLTALAFALGVVLTFALMIRRVEREIPLSQATGGDDAAGKDDRRRNQG
ncbi:hypothetical protein [Mycobacterium heckeshornense]|uniref:channel accessory protein ArfC n=1 Tax=Mycobacterium heckeshornense TaxID=110505 RepID=UPI000A6D44A7|nr:hypothetical protein [Mycobacterium heckeshornense]BCQ07689.1 putative membrane protein ArfC [Mycobacterium heckeshornense]